MKHHIEYRQADPVDIDFIYQLLKNIVDEADLSERFSQTRDSLHQAIFSDNAFIEAKIAEISGKPVGLCLFSLTQNNFYLFNSHGMFIHSLCVMKNYRRFGVATGLMQEIRKIAKQRDCDRIDGLVLKSNVQGFKFCQSLKNIELVDYIHYMREKLY